MTRYGDSIERIQATLTLMVWMAILFLPLSLQAATLEEKRATRLERMGVMIGRAVLCLSLVMRCTNHLIFYSSDRF